MENKFSGGEVVFERIRPSRKLSFRRYAANMYYCRADDDPKRKDLVFFEGELVTGRVKMSQIRPLSVKWKMVSRLRIYQSIAFLFLFW